TQVAGQADDVAVAQLGQVALAPGRGVARLHAAQVPTRDLDHRVQPHEVVPDGAVVELAEVASQLDQRLHATRPDAALGQRPDLVLEGAGGAVEVAGDGAGVCRARGGDVVATDAAALEHQGRV